MTSNWRCLQALTSQLEDLQSLRDGKRAILAQGPDAKARLTTPGFAGIDDSKGLSSVDAGLRKTSSPPHQ